MSHRSTLTVPPSVARALRAELLRELSSTADLLSALTFAGRIEEEQHYRHTMARLDSARALIGQLGVVAPSVEAAVELGVDEHALTAYRVLKARHARALQEVEDAGVERRAAPVADPALAEFLEELRREIDSQGSIIARLGAELLGD